jgi:spermidine/putrescine transport system permease protein
MRRGPGAHAVTAAAMLGMAFLLAPIAMMVALSFNRTEGRFDFVWHGFSARAWAHPFAVDGLLPALQTSIVLAIMVAIAATAIGTALAYAQVRYPFRGSAAIDLVLLLTIATPEVIMGSALLDLFLDLEIPTGAETILLSHIMFDIAFVTIMVKSRLRGFDLTLEQAAMDLGARPGRVFLRITLPLIAPAVIAAGLLALVLSLDDFIISMFVSGEVITFPLFVWGTARIAMPPQIYVIGTSILAALTAALLAVFVAEQRRQRLAGG